MRPRRVMFLWWGRRGAMARFTLDLAMAATRRPDIDTTVSIAVDQERFADFAFLGERLFPVKTFSRAAGAIRIDRIARIRRDVESRLRADSTDLAVVLMPHVWSRFVGDLFRRRSVQYAVLVHDATPHPGDPAAAATIWLNREADRADVTLTLSRHVAEALRSSRSSGREVVALFHPVFCVRAAGERASAKALRVLFFGRLHAYRGLDMLVGAVQLARTRGVLIELGVFGAGDISALAQSLRDIGARVVNRWIDEKEIPAILAEHDVVALPHVEASQSGVAALAHGAGLPVVANGVGGLMEQVRHEVDGLIVERSDESGFADALVRLADDRVLLEKISEGARDLARVRTMDAFLDALLDACAGSGLESGQVAGA